MTTKKTFGNRKFYALPEEYPLRVSKVRSSHTPKKTEETSKLIKYIDENVIGRNHTFTGPYGRRKVVYCDYTASGRSLQFIEDYVLREVLPCYGNTHTTTSITSMQSTLFRHEARDIIRNAVHASEHDAVIFAGSGCTGAVHKLIHALDLAEAPVVFVGPYEHHSNLLPWRELGATIVRIAETREGFLDLLDLERQLGAHQGAGRQLIGCFSAASNITGILADDVATTLLLHQYGALAFWDYAAAAPYVKLDMNPLLPGVDETSVHKDAMFFSMHKFIGGVQTPGVLVAKKALFRSAAPDGCGGGTVFFVTRDSHRYLQDTELREEGGTAAVVESVRAGLVMQLKETVGVLAIMAREQKIARMVLSHVRTIPELLLLGSGSQSVKRLPIFSFLVRHPRGTFLHHNFVCAVLNDVFGVQARGGCACAGPYAQDLLGIDEDLAAAYESVLLEDKRLDRVHLRRHEEHSSFEMLRPGFARVSLPFFMGDAEVAFVLEALKMVATEAWKLLPQYILNPETGEWRHHTNSVFRDRKWLGHIRYVDGKMTVNERRVSGCGTFPQEHADVLQTARNIFNKARKMAQRYPLADQCVMFDERTERLRWFMLPSEAQDLLLGNSHNVKHDVPFQPAVYAGSRGSVSEGCGGGAGGSAAPSPVPPPASPPGGLPPPPPTPPPPPRLASPRHSSLPCIDQHFAAPPPPLPLSDSCDGAFAAGAGGAGPALQQPVTLLRPLHFAVGEAVTPQPLLTSPLARSPAHAHCLAAGPPGRTRCHSLGSASRVSPPVLSPVTMAHLGLAAAGAGARAAPAPAPPPAGRRSCSSQTDLHSLELGAAGGASPLSSLGLLQLAAGSYNDCSSLGHGSPLGAHHAYYAPAHHGPSKSPEDLHAYVNEVTKQITAEIKSEIREVISKVEDVLSDSGEGPHNGCYEKARSNSGSSGGGCDNGLPSPSPPPAPPRAAPAAHASGGGPVSALEVAEYLMGMSREMASEMKSEIREMVSAVDCLISPDGGSGGGGGGGGGARHACTAPRPGSAASAASEASPRSPRSPRSPASPPSAAATSPDPSSAPDLSLAGPSPFLSSKMADLAGERTQSSECSSDETVIHVMAAAGGRDPAATAASSPAGAPLDGSGRSEEDGEGETEDGDGWDDDGAGGGGAGGGKHALLVRSTINSVSSQDSGINLTFHESDSSSPGNTLAKDATGARRRKTNLTVGSTGGVGSLQQLSRAALELRRRCDAGNCYLTEEELTERTADVEETAAVASNVVGLENGMARWHCPPKAIWKPAVEALQEFDMIRDGDRVMVCLSGGKDSLSLLHTLHQYQFYARAKGVHFILGAATVDPGSSAYDPRPLIPYMESLGVHYLYEEQPILQQAAALDRCTSICSFCSRMKRGRLYAAARKHGYNVLALGQHLDDLSESFLMSVFHNGRLRSMKAHYYIRERDLRVIRPFVYVREKALRQFAESRKLPVIPENCPACFETPKERHRSKQLLAQQEILFPKLFWSLRSALHPLISFRYTGEESRTYMRHRKHSQSHGAAPPADVDDSSDTDEEPVA